MNSLKLLIVLLATTLFAACSAQSAKEAVAPPLAPSQDYFLQIPQNAFGKRYLLSTSVIPQDYAATGTASIGRVVTFEKFADGVDLYESTQGKIVTNDLPARRLLATFPIVSSDNSSTVIDFNQGMRRMIFSSWWLSDYYFQPERLDRAAELPQARVFEITKHQQQLVIRQSVQARSRQFDTDIETKLELRYFFAPYNPGKFEPLELTEQQLRYSNFFAAPTSLDETSGRPTRKIARFDPSKPIVFHYSDNTPADMESAVREGILYWNKAFGKEIVEARKAPEGVAAPDPRYNIVQWVPWDNAGFAYADANLDPLTGQTHHGQAFMTSVFELGGKANARRLLRSLRGLIELHETADSDSDDGDKHASHRFVGDLCSINRLDFAREFADGLEELLAKPELSDEAVTRLAQDYVREVTAHEVGHVLGLRHNFAGSLTATLTPKRLDQFLEAYISNNDLEEFAQYSAGNSVMDYNVFNATAFMGWQMNAADSAFSYDRAAIQMGYVDPDSILEAKPLFASDEHVEVFEDVRRFDYGSTPLLANYQNLSSRIANLPNQVIEAFIAARAPQDPRDRQPLETVALRTSAFADQFAYPIRNILNWFRKETRSRKIEHAFDFIGETNLEERQKAHWDALKEQLESLGGVDQTLFAHLPAKLELKTKEELEDVAVAPKLDAKSLAERLEKLLDSPAYETFVGLDEETYTWTDDEKKIILEKSKALFGDLEEAVLAATLAVYEDAPRDLGLAATGHLQDDDPAANLEKRIVDLAKFVILEKDPDSTIRGKVDKSIVEVPDFKYSYETRVAAAKALNDKTGTFEAWSKEAKASLHEALKTQLDESLNIKLYKDFDDSLLSRSLREWYLRQQNLLKMLPPDPKKNSNGQ